MVLLLASRLSYGADQRRKHIKIRGSLHRHLVVCAQVVRGEFKQNAVPVQHGGNGNNYPLVRSRIFTTFLVQILGP